MITDIRNIVLQISKDLKNLENLCTWNNLKVSDIFTVKELNNDIIKKLIRPLESIHRKIGDIEFNLKEKTNPLKYELLKNGISLGKFPSYNILLVDLVQDYFNFGVGTSYSGGSFIPGIYVSNKDIEANIELCNELLNKEFFDLFTMTVSQAKKYVKNHTFEEVDHVKFYQLKIKNKLEPVNYEIINIQ